jgi:Glycosyl hydrolase family 3 N terminal domain
MSDWGATTSTLPSATGGLDLEMPSGRYTNPAALKAELASGELSMQAIDDKVRRILRVSVRFGFLIGRGGIRASPNLIRGEMKFRTRRPSLALRS